MTEEALEEKTLKDDEFSTIGWYFILIVCCGFEGGILVQEVSDD